MKVNQLSNELSEMSSQLMIKEKELTKLKEDNKLSKTTAQKADIGMSQEVSFIQSH